MSSPAIGHGKRSEDEAAERTASIVAHCRDAQRAWSAVPPTARAALFGRARGLIAAGATELAESVRRRPAVETMTGELLPLLEAARFLELSAARLLRPKRYARRRTPLWLAGVELEIVREPFGVVLIIGPANYPLMLPGIQALQALAAGNAVIVKPGRGGGPALQRFAAVLIDAGAPRDLVAVTDESAETSRALCRSGVDKIVFTGSHAVGRSVLVDAASSVTPAAVELSGWDAVFVRDDADLDFVARALAFGMTFNGGESCIAPRRVFVSARRAAVLERRLLDALDQRPAPAFDDARAAAGSDSAATAAATVRCAEELIAEAIARGARLLRGGNSPDQSRGQLPATVLADVSAQMRIARTEVFASLLMILPVHDDEEALNAAASCPYALGATVFGGDLRAARALAERIDAGVVVLNDAILPTADPRVPFAGRRASGFGVTRGAEGLLAMTRPKAIATAHGRRRHLDAAAQALSPELVAAFIESTYGNGARVRLAGAVRLARALFAGRTWGLRRLYPFQGER